MNSTPFRTSHSTDPPTPQELQHLEFLAAAGLQSTCGPCHPILCDRPSFAAEYAGFGRWLLQRRQRATELRERRAAAAAAGLDGAPGSDLRRPSAINGEVGQQWGGGSGKADGERYNKGGSTASAAAEFPAGMTPVEAAGGEEPSASTLESIDGWDIGGVEFTDLGIPSITRQPLWLVFSAENGGSRSDGFSSSGSSSSSQDEGVQGGSVRDAGSSPGGHPEQQQPQQMARGGEEGGETAHIAEALLLRADAAAGDSLPLQRRGGGASASSPRQQSAAGAAPRSSSKSGRPAKPRKRGAGSSTSDEGLGFDPDEGWALGGAEGK